VECEEPTSVDMESESEHHVVPEEDAIVKQVVGQRKWHRDWNLAEEQG
jgi:hypothetical protein